MSRQDQKPWAAPFTHAWAWLVMPWPRSVPVRVLRGAIIEAVGELGADLEEWSQHMPDGTRIQSDPRVLYRLGRAGPEVHLLGERAPDLAETLKRIESLRLPAGERIPVEAVRARVERTEVAHTKERAHRYELVTPYFPCDAVHRRRPREDDPDALAYWSSQALESSIREWMDAWGPGEKGALPLHVSMVSGRLARVRWDRPERDARVERRGVVGSFLVNALLPDGIGIGAKVSEGHGEIRRVRQVQVDRVSDTVRRRRDAAA